MFDQVDLVYGFNFPETNFVWTQHRFGIRPRSNLATWCLIRAQYFHDHGTLKASTASRNWAFPLQRGEQWIALRDADLAAIHFSVEPERKSAADPRELGILVQGIEPFDGEKRFRQYVAEHHCAIEYGEPTSERIVQPPRSGELVQGLYRYIMDGFASQGWLMGFISGIKPREFLLSLALYPPRKYLGREDGFRVRTNRVLAGEFADSLDHFLISWIPEDCLRFQHRLTLDDPNSLDIDVIHLPSGEAVFPWQSYHWRGLGDLPMPSASHIERVAGEVDPVYFAFTGATWYVKLRALTAKYLGKELEGVPSILDWGCGCGRILRFFPSHLRSHLTGIDIDPVAIEWCASNIVGPRFVCVDTEPPCALPDNSFDMIYGHSVFTHLAEPDQFKWLHELRRLLRPGGFAFVTVLAELSYFALYRGRKAPNQLLEYVDRGIYDDGHLNVGVDAAQPGYYRSTQHTSGYIWENWSQYFDVVDIIDGFADMQSLVVLKRLP